MRERPLSISIIGWIHILFCPLGIAMLLFAEAESGNQLGISPEAVRFFDVLTLTVGLLSSVMILRGKKWARACLIVAMLLDLLSSLLIEGASKGENMFDVLFLVVVAWVLYRPRGTAFFNATDDVPPLTYQAGTAVCYIILTFFMVPAMAMPAGWEYEGDRVIYKSILLGVAGAIVFAIGKAAGVVLHPKRDVGSMFIMAAVFSLGFTTSVFLNSTGARAAADPRVDLWVSALITVIFVVVGAMLIHRARVEGRMSPPVAADNALE